MTRSYGRTPNTSSSQGLWALRVEPGPNFRWGAIKRRSQYNADGTEDSTARQEDAIFNYVEQHNEGRIVAVYSDIASAFDEKARRPEFENALEDLRAERINGIIVWKLDRLTRRKSQMRRILTLLEDCGGRLVSVVEGIDTADPAKREITELVLNVYIGIAQGESEAISERVRLMQYDRARKGLVSKGGERPFGLTGDWTELVPAEVKVLHEAGERVLEGEAAYSIARDFTARDIETTRGTTLWYPEVLLKMLRSPRMIAMKAHGGKLYPYDNVPAIFEREEWERICAKLERKPAAPTETRMLSNIALCDGCLSPLRASGWNGSRSRPEFTYRCRHKTKVIDDGACGKLSILGGYADAEVSRRVIAWISNRKNISRVLLTYADRENLAEIQAREAELTTALQDLAEARFNPPPGVQRMTDETYYGLVAEIEGERRENHRRLVVTREAGMLNGLMEMKDHAAEWEAQSVSWRRRVLSLVVATIVIERRGKGCEPGTRPHERRFDPTRIRMQFVGDAIE
jgi:site-specific DNA recombinase